jgi:hypothetical protein
LTAKRVGKALIKSPFAGQVANVSPLVTGSHMLSLQKGKWPESLTFRARADSLIPLQLFARYAIVALASFLDGADSA